MSHKPTIALAADHAGYALKEALKAELLRQGYQAVDLGTHSEDSVDYPDYGHQLAEAILSGKASIGIAVCGSGIGISIAANRHEGIRAALVRSPEEARLARQHNDANVLALGGRITDVETAKACLEAFLRTPFEGGRHAGRVAKLG